MTANVHSIYDEYETDTSAEKSGAWVEFRGGARLRLRAMASHHMRVLQQKLLRKYRQFYDKQTGMLPPDKQDEQDVALAVGLVTDWESVKDRAGKALAFTPDNVRQVMADLPRMRAEVLAAATMEETFRTTSLEEQGEGLPPVSAPSTSESGDTAADNS